METTPAIAEESFVFEGSAAREVAVFLGIEKGGTLELELPEVLVNGGPDQRNRITWDPTAGLLTFQGRWYDWKHTQPRRPGPSFSFDGPRELDQKSLAIFKHWAKLNQRIQGHGKPIGKRPSEMRRSIRFRMESDKQRKASWLSRWWSGLLKKGQIVMFESLYDRQGKGLWIEVRVGPWLK